MKLYRTLDKNSNLPDIWTGSASDASKAKTKLKADLKERDCDNKQVEVQAVEVPTNKQGLIAFLNELST